MSLPEVCRRLQGKLIVSCQAAPGEIFHGPQLMTRFARAAVAGGAAGIRANGPEDVRAIRAAVSVPVIGIWKTVHQDGRVLITASLEAARELVEAGADMIALDCTRRGVRYGALERLRRIRDELGVPVLADIATVDEAAAAAEAGATFVLSTLRGYTEETAGISRFEPRFIEETARAAGVPAIAEGRIQSPGEARAAMAAGAFAVIVGTAITRPREITRSFAGAVEREVALRHGASCCVGIDLGGTNAKYGLVAAGGKLLFDASIPTPATAGRQALLDTLKRAVKTAREAAAAAGISVAAVGIATAGWVDAETGRIAYATDNLPGWTGTPVAQEMEAACGLPVAVENDANALAVAEKAFGTGRTLSDFVCITLGTGVGAGCYTAGRLNRGAHFFANALGHMILVPGGIPCNCGRDGCLEVYCNAAALVRYAGGGHGSAAEVIAAANRGDAAAVRAVRTVAGYLAQGCASVVQLLDPQAIILSGGLVLDNPHLVRGVEEELPRLVSVWEQRSLSVVASGLGYFGGVLGAAALARDKVFRPSRTADPKSAP